MSGASEYEAAESLPHRSRKDKRRWCGGHKWREHRFEWTAQQSFGFAWREGRCALCGKKILADFRDVG